MLAICVASYFKISTKNIKEAIEGYRPQNNRSQIIRTKENVIIADAYNANPSSMIGMLQSFCEQEYDNKLCILGDMLELGKATREEHEIIRSFINKQNLNTIFIGNHFYSANDKRSFIDRLEFISFLKDNPIKNKTILLKGSRSMKLEELIQYL